MNRRTVELAEQLLESVPQSEMTELIRMLNYYNSNFNEVDRVRALRNGSTGTTDEALEKAVRETRMKTAGSQNSYITTNSNVCKCCGK